MLVRCALPFSRYYSFIARNYAPQPFTSSKQRGIPKNLRTRTVQLKHRKPLAALSQFRPAVQKLSFVSLWDAVLRGTCVQGDRLWAAV